MVLVFKPKTSHILGKHSTTELQLHLMDGFHCPSLIIKSPVLVMHVSDAQTTLSDRNVQFSDLCFFKEIFAFIRMALGLKYANFGNHIIVLIRNDSTELQYWSNSLVFLLKQETECK